MTSTRTPILSRANCNIDTVVLSSNVAPCPPDNTVTFFISWDWEKKVNRIILPANDPLSVTNESEAVNFTIDMGDNYNPSCKLKIASNPVNYSLPKNTKLDLTGYIKEPLMVNIEASEWENVDEDWNISGIKVLNVSDLEVSITDFNGARISFTSNMPVVKVMPQLYVGAGGLAAETEKVFNDLVLLNGDVKDSGTTITYTTSRFLIYL